MPRTSKQDIVRVTDVMLSELLENCIKNVQIFTRCSCLIFTLLHFLYELLGYKISTYQFKIWSEHNILIPKAWWMSHPISFAFCSKVLENESSILWCVEHLITEDYLMLTEAENRFVFSVCLFCFGGFSTLILCLGARMNQIWKRALIFSFNCTHATHLHFPSPTL